MARPKSKPEPKPDETWRQRRLPMRLTPPRPPERDLTPVHLARAGKWQRPADGTAPAPFWYSEDGYQRDEGQVPERVSLPHCSERCPWFQPRGVRRALMALAGESVPRGMVLSALCAYEPIEDTLDTDVADMTGVCWPAYSSIWRRAFQTPESEP